MRLRLGSDKGELGLALVFGAVGVLWAAIALGLPLWEGFAPQRGFLPLVYGALLTVLSAIIIANLIFGHHSTPAAQPFGKPLLILVILVATVAGLRVAGFAPAIFLMLVLVFAAIERLPIVWSLVAAAATTGAMLLIFEIWLRVPLPKGPLGV
jgi:hypothetical protein